MATVARATVLTTLTAGNGPRVRPPRGLAPCPLWNVIACIALLLSLMAAAPSAARSLQIFFIDVEGGQATLIVTAAGESLLIDTGRGRPSRDPDRVMAAIREAGVTRLDYLLLTHFHSDHAGGVSELASQLPIGTFID